MSLTQFQNRLHIICGIFFLLFAVLILRAVYFGAVVRDRYLKSSMHISERVINIPARRGSIFDRNGVKLLWSERCFDLWCILPANKTSTTAQIGAINQALPERKIEHISGKSQIVSNLTAEETLALEPLIRRGYPLRIRSVVKRKKLDNAIVRKKAGYVRDGQGISGWEKEYNSILSGANGKGLVSVDRRQNWIPGSFKLITPPQHGKDVTLPVIAENNQLQENRL